MFSLQISRDTVEKLTHKSIEIRLRALEQISSKLNRALALNEYIEFNIGELCKQLIRWFGFIPVQQPLHVLKLINSIIESPTYGVRAVDKVGIERFKKEIRKIQILFEGQKEEMKIIQTIKQNLIKCKNTQCEVESYRKISKNMAELTLSTSTINFGSELNLEDYELPWSCPCASDYATMKFLSDKLKSPLASFDEMENVAEHLRLIMSDYPAEYMLQGPHILLHLLELYDGHKNDERKIISLESVGKAILEFLLNLDKRIRMLRKTNNFRKSSGGNCNNQLSSLNSSSPCQLKYDKALANILKISINHLEKYAPHDNTLHLVWEIIFKVLKIMDTMQRKVMDIFCLQEVASMIIKLNLKLTDSEHCTRVRLHQIKMMFFLQDYLSICSRQGSELKYSQIFDIVLHDYCMKLLFNKRHKNLETIAFQASTDFKEQYQLLQSYEESFGVAIKLIKNDKQWSCNEIIAQGISINVFDILQSQRLIDIVFDAIVNACPIYISNVNLRNNALSLLLKLLNLTCLPLKRYLYSKTCSVFKRHIGCFMTGERYVLECTNSELLNAQIIGIPLSTELLLQFVYDAFENDCNEIQSNCLKIFEILLQSQNLFGANWYSLWPIITPVLPLLTCCTSTKKIEDLLLKLYNPDLKLIPYICVLKGNLILLFSKNEEIRSEALNRLLYSISSLKDSDNYIPNLTEVADTLPHDICSQNSDREYTNIFKDHSPLGPDVLSSLNNLLQLMESSDVEPLIRKTTLMQLNVLCTNWHLTGELSKSGAYFLVLRTLENALQKTSSIDYPDSALPAISILNKLLLYDSSVRFELSDTPNIYILILRALITFNHDIQIRQDAAMCLFQLLFASNLISTETMIEGPAILGNLHIPFTLKMRPALSKNVQQQFEKLPPFCNMLNEGQYWRLVIGVALCDGLINITHKSISLLSQFDIKDDLKLTIQDIRLIRATQPSVSLYRLSKAALNCTDHKSLIEVCIMLKHQLQIAKLRDTFSVEEDFCIDLNIILHKYLQLSPGNKIDLQLYEHLLDVLIICLDIPLYLIIPKFLKFLQKDMHHAFITLIIQSEEIPLRIYDKITVVMRLIINACNMYSSETESISFYSNLFDLIIERCLHLLKIRDLQQVRCLLSLVPYISLSKMEMSDQLLFFYCRRLAQLSLALKSFTQTGAQWHRHCLLGILHLNNQMQNPHINFRLSAGFVKYFSGLCGHSDNEVRVLSWSILNTIVKTKRIDTTQSERKSSDISGSELLITELSYLPGGFMACCLSTLLDVEEVVGVRHLAGQLLAILIRKQHQKVEEIVKLFERHQFLFLITETFATASFILGEEIPTDLEVTKVLVLDCDILSCYALICVEFSLRQPSFLKDLCSQTFMFKLYEIFKLSPPDDNHEGYLNTVGHISRLYTLCYLNNFTFLRRTICRDIAWITCFCNIFFKIVAPSGKVNVIIDMLQLFMVLCKDSSALDQLSAKLIEYTDEIINLFENSLTIKNLNTRLQSSSLSMLSILLIKTQQQVNTDISINILGAFEISKTSIKSIKNRDNSETNSAANEMQLQEEMGKFSKIFIIFLYWLILIFKL